MLAFGDERTGPNPEARKHGTEGLKNLYLTKLHSNS